MRTRSDLFEPGDLVAVNGRLPALVVSVMSDVCARGFDRTTVWVVVPAGDGAIRRDNFWLPLERRRLALLARAGDRCG